MTLRDTGGNFCRLPAKEVHLSGHGATQDQGLKQVNSYGLRRAANFTCLAENEPLQHVFDEMVRPISTGRQEAVACTKA